MKRIATLLERSRESRLTDLCAGGGLYDRMLVGKLRKLTGDGAIRCTLTDLYPNRNWARVKELSGGMVDFAAVPLSAERAVAGLPGVHLMFSALHHFSPEEIAGLLRAGAAKGRTLAFFDYSRRELLPELPPVLLSPVLLWCVSFLVFPFSWRRLFFTYLIPVLPLVLLGVYNLYTEEKPRFATLPAQLSISTITLEEALDLFKLPRTLGNFEEKPVVVNTGRFGPYVQHNRKFVSIPKGEDPMDISYERAVELIQAKREAEEKSHLKSFEEEPGLEVRSGRFGPYISFEGTNYKIPKAQAERAAELTLEECRKIIESTAAAPKTGTKRTAKAKKTRA